MGQRDLKVWTEEITREWRNLSMAEDNFKKCATQQLVQLCQEVMSLNKDIQMVIVVVEKVAYFNDQHKKLECNEFDVECKPILDDIHTFLIVFEKYIPIYLEINRVDNFDKNNSDDFERALKAMIN